MIDSVTGAREKVKALAAARSTRGVFLTVTLSTSRLDDWRLQAPTFINSESNRITKEREYGKEEKRLLQADLDYLLGVLEYEITPKTQGLALFADGPAGLTERIELPYRLTNRVVVEPSPYIRPIVQAVALLEPFVLAQVSRDESSLFLVDEWGVAQEDDLTGPWLKSSDPETGELSIKKYFAANRQNSLVELHFKEVGAALARLLDASGARRVVLCAQHDIASSFRRALPAGLGPKIVAEIPLDAAATTGQTVKSARQALEKARGEELETLARRIKEGLGKGGHGIAGLEDVIGAVERRQVQTLLVDSNYSAPGWRCADCAWMGLAPVDSCPICGEPAVPLGDAVGEVIRQMITQNGIVEVADDMPLLNEMGGIAGVLRYT